MRCCVGRQFRFLLHKVTLCENTTRLVGASTREGFKVLSHNWDSFLPFHPHCRFGVHSASCYEGREYHRLNSGICRHDNDEDDRRLCWCSLHEYALRVRRLTDDGGDDGDIGDATHRINFPPVIVVLPLSPSLEAVGERPPPPVFKAKNALVFLIFCQR